MPLTKESSSQIAIELQSSLSKDVRILTDPSHQDFKTSIQHWSDSDIKYPAAIIKPATEHDVLTIFSTALSNSIPIALKSGGNTPWSSISSPGWLIDLSLLQTLSIDPETQTATIQSGVLTKALNKAVSEKGFVTPTPSSGNVAYIPFLLSGGSSLLAGRCGMACDSLLSARIITSSSPNQITTVSSTSNPDLFYALKGAGQFFGIVVEVTVKIYKLKDEIISWTLIFPGGRVEEVAAVLERVVNTEVKGEGGSGGDSPGMCGVFCPAGNTKPLILLSITHLTPSLTEEVMKPLISLSPLQNMKKPISWAEVTNSSDAFSAFGGQNSIVSCGLQSFSAGQLIEAVNGWKKIISEAPTAGKTLLLFSWYSTVSLRKIPEESSAWSHRDVGVWFMGFVSATDMQSNKTAVRIANEVLAYCQKDQKEEEKAMFPAHSRGDNLKYRYRGEERLERLRELKRSWDPEGVFTTQFL